MAYSTSMNNANTVIGESTSAHFNFRAASINPADWTKTECTRDRVVLVNANSDYSAPNHVRIERSRIANVYEGSGISTNYQLPSKRGVKLFMQCNSIATVSDSTDPTVRIELPYAASLTMRVPAVPTNLVSYVNVFSVLQQLIGLIAPGSAGGTSPTNDALASSLAKYLSGSIDFTSR
jgi:hypothetical protein